MGFYVTATLLYGVAAPDDWSYLDADEALPPGGPLVFAESGDVEWDPGDRTVILGVRGSEHDASEGGPEQLGPQIELPDVRVIVNARKLFEHILPGRPWDPQWWLLGHRG